MNFLNTDALGLLLTALLVPVLGSGTVQWSYTTKQTNPAHWESIGYPVCAGSKQSPINLSPHQAQFEHQLEKINISTESSKVPPATMENNGHTVELMFQPNTWFVSFSDNKKQQYEVVQLHFHWGGVSKVGSEHTLVSHRFPIEAHLVTFNKMLYDTVEEAKSGTSGLAVLGFWFNIKNRGSSNLINAIVPLLNSVVKPGQTVEVPNADLRLWFQRVDKGKYFQYDGSLTTPPCTENVKWTIFTTAIPITEQQLSVFRHLVYGNSERSQRMVNNFRPLQRIGNRQVSRSWKVGSNR